MFILSHGRADKIFTLGVLERTGYTGDWFIVIDNEDETAHEYYKNYGEENVILFDKKAISETFDTADNFNNRKTIVYARNACFQIAKDLGYRYFMELDDDYNDFSFRFNHKKIFKHLRVKNLDLIIEKMIRFYDVSGATCLAVAQGGDYIGGVVGMFGKQIFLRRKAMNTQLCSTDREFQFLGRINEDVNTYISMGHLGKLFFTTNLLAINQKPTQSNEGGMTETYLESGTYVKSFYSIIFSPSSVRIALMGNKNMRIHHKISWKNTTPYILDEKYKKS